MLTTAFQRVMIAAVAITATGAARSAQATTITFDQVVTPGPGVVPQTIGLAVAYGAVAPSTVSFITQGFDFGGLTGGVTVGPTFPFPSVVDGSACGGGLVCDGHFLGHNQPLSLTTDGGLSGMSLVSLMAAAQPPGQQNPSATTLRVVGFQGNSLVADQTFALGASFQLFTLNNDPDWANVNRVVFQPLTAAGAPGVVLIDNIVENPVPEPASLVLLGTGLAGLAARRRAKRARP